MLNDRLADLAQLLALPLEVVGLSLASIELFAPATAERVADFIRAQAGRFKPWLQLPLAAIFIPFLLTMAFRSDWRDGLWQAIAMLYPATLIFMLVVCWVAVRVRPVRAIGMSGVIIATTGLILEAYQVAVFLASR